MKLVNGVVNFVNSPAGQAAKQALSKGLDHAKWAAQNPKAAMGEINRAAREGAEKARDMAIWARNNPAEARKLAAQKLKQGFDSVIHNGGKAIRFIAGPTVQALKDSIKFHHENIKHVGRVIGGGLNHARNKVNEGLNHARNKVNEGLNHARNKLNDLKNRARNIFGRRQLAFEEETLLALEHFDAEEYLQLIEITEAGYEEELAYEFSREERLAEVEEFLSEQQYFHSKSLVMSEVQLSEEEQKVQEEAFIDGIMEVSDHHVKQEVMAEAEEEIAEEIIPEEEWTEEEVSEELLGELLARLINSQLED